MNLSTPIIICDENEEVRLLLKEMLTKHGYFHLLEAHSSQEVLPLMTGGQFLLIQRKLVDPQIHRLLSKSRKFLIIAQNEEPQTMTLAATYGVDHLIALPYTSRSLVEKITSLMA